MKDFEEFECNGEAGPSFTVKSSPSSVSVIDISDQKMLKQEDSAVKRRSMSPRYNHQDSNTSMTSEAASATRSSSASNSGQDTINADPLDILESRVAGDAEASQKEKSNRKYSRSHQRRFHRRFPSIDSGEMLIDWFNCALIADILLQGYLYISDNYFAFYSNIFGYKTQILIPVSDVVSVTKEKTAKIFPNAVGICTEEAKYVFGSLISRESTFRLMQEVWRTTLRQVASVSCLDRIKHMKEVRKQRIALESCIESHKKKSGQMDDEDEDDDSDESPSHSNGDNSASSSTPLDNNEVTRGRKMWVAVKGWASRQTSQTEKRTRKWLLAGITVALVLLLLSATILIFRANRVYSRLTQLTGEDVVLNIFNPTASYSSQSDAIGGKREEDADVQTLQKRATGQAALVTDHIKKIARSLQFKLGEVAQLRSQLDTLFNADCSSLTPRSSSCTSSSS